MKYYLFLICFAFTPLAAYAADSLFFLEAQTVAGYSFKEDKIIYRSAHSQYVMQKNSVGFDYIKKFSPQTTDIASAALQMRMTYNEEENKLQLQVYNAFLKAKTDLADIWAGHNRIAFGLASYWDTHGDLLQPLPMYGFGCDRDWGVGFNKYLQNGDLQFALTSATGMGLEAKGNWLITSRISKGVLNYDNYNIAASFMGGRTLEAMGYKIMDYHLKNIILAGLDGAYNHGTIEHKAEINIGRKNEKTAFAAFYRLSINFMEESALKLEGQSVYAKLESEDNFALAGGLTYRLNSYLSARSMYEWQYKPAERKIITQLYYYFAL
ncbi:MAG: hypothetical protein LBG46_00100 [Elusimicrobiota bacterium]|nr:hypothetical protein [Elusimicrobiota bacterium]